MESWLVTGGAGFIGSNFILSALKHLPNLKIINLDKLTYAGNLNNLTEINDKELYTFIKGDICSKEVLKNIFCCYAPQKIIHFAAESHVDKSIQDPYAFIQTNILGTFHLLQEALIYWQNLPEKEAKNFKFIHISTDEVFGSLGPHDWPFNEKTAYAPNSPYAASKAGADHLVRAFYHTYRLPILITNCSNNYGPYQYPEKLIPLTILNALAGKQIPVYGDGLQIRDWLYVEDHCRAIISIINQEEAGETYNIGGKNEKTNLEVILEICAALDKNFPKSSFKPHSKLVKHIADRAGHDRRYAIDATKLEKKLNWKPLETFQSGIQKTVNWYIENRQWVNNITKDEKYLTWIKTNYSV